MQPQILITLKDGNEFVVPATAEVAHRRVHPEKILSITPYGNPSKQAAENEDAIQKMIDAKKKEIAKRVKDETPQEITEDSTKAQIAQALTDAELKFNPNHRKSDLYNIYASSRTN